MLDEGDTASDHLLPILRLLQEPPDSPSQFSTYLGLVSKSLMPLGRLEGENALAGQRVMATAAKSIHDGSLFRSLAKLLIKEHGLDPHECTAKHQSPMDCAIAAMNITAVRFLMDHFASASESSQDALNDPVRVKKITGFLSLACQVIKSKSHDPEEHRPIQILQLLATHCGQMGPFLVKRQTSGLLFEICNGDTDLFEAVRILLKNGVDANGVDGRTGQSPLHQAARNNHWKTAIELVNAGADIDAKDFTGKSAYECAEESGVVSSEMRAIFRSAKMNNLIFGKTISSNKNKPH